MGKLVLCVSDDEIFRRIDKEFQVAFVSPRSTSYPAGSDEVVVIDSQSETEIRATVQNIYKRYRPHSKR